MCVACKRTTGCRVHRDFLGIEARLAILRRVESRDLAPDFFEIELQPGATRNDLQPSLGRARGARVVAIDQLEDLQRLEARVDDPIPGNTGRGSASSPPARGSDPALPPPRAGRRPNPPARPLPWPPLPPR